MSDDESSWQQFHSALYLFVEEFAASIRRDGLSDRKILRWRAINSGHYDLEPLTERTVQDKTGNDAFNLASFAALRRAAHQSPLGRQIGRAAGPVSLPYYINLGDFAFRTAQSAITSSDSITVDPEVIRQRFVDLRALIESQTAGIEIIVLLRGFWLRDRLRLSDQAEMIHLSDQELLNLITADLIAPRCKVDKFADRPLPEVVLGDVDRVALRRYVVQPNVVGTDLPPQALDTASIVADDVGRLTDVVSIINAHWFNVVGWIYRGAGTVLGSAAPFGSQSIDPLPRPTFMTQPGFDLDAQSETFVRRWRQLQLAELDDNGHTLRLAARRVGFAVTRRNEEDRLLDAIIALDAILARDEPTGRGIGHKIGTRAAHVWPDEHPEISYQEVTKIVKGGYELRSRIAHGGPAEAHTVGDTASRVLLVARTIVSEFPDRRDARGSYDYDWRDELRSFKGKKGH